MIVFTSSGAENTSEINIPLESKYWYLENSLKEEKIKKKFKKEALFNIVHIMLHLHTNHSTLTLHRLYITDSWDPQIQASCMKLEGSVSYQLSVMNVHYSTSLSYGFIAQDSNKTSREIFVP